MMQTSGWIEVLKPPEETERPKENVHYKLIEPPGWKPKTVLFHKTSYPPASLITVSLDRIGDNTDSITVLATEATIACDEPKEYSDDDRIHSPKTPQQQKPQRQY